MHPVARREGSWGRGPQGPRPAASASVNLTQAQILGPLPRPTAADTLGLRPSDLCLPSPPGDTDVAEVCKSLA